MENIVCTVEAAYKLLEHMNKDDLVVLTVINRRTHEHGETKKIRKESGEKYIQKAEEILYQDNDFFGTLVLSGVLRDKDIIHSMLFPRK